MQGADQASDRQREASCSRLVIAIDGPAASGKSTVGELLARSLGYLYFDSGVLYRAVTWASLRRGLDMEDEERVSRLAAELEMVVMRPTVEDGRQHSVLLAGQDITWDLRRPAVEMWVSLVSSYAGVRRALLAQQRELAKCGGIVMVGRDIGTVILPQADLKIYLTASAEVRARRRWRELQARDEEADYGWILAEMRQRDRFDSSRPIAPLGPAEDAVVINTDDLSIEEVWARICRLVEERGEKCASTTSQTEC